MTLTEEQRAAIHAVSGLLTAIGCPQCHSYLQKNYTHHIEVLRAMVDSSGTVGPSGGFDLEKARDALDEPICPAGQHRVVLELQGALAEIERLRAENAGLSKAVIETQEERDLAQAEFRGYHKAWEEQATRVQELEDALVEERTGAIRCESYDHCEGMYRIDLPDAMIRAQQELQAEGKIGPDARPRSWQITDERKAALNSILEYISYDSHDDIEICGHADILRAMLRGAE